jgi:hypothetical protein
LEGFFQIFCECSLIGQVLLWRFLFFVWVGGFEILHYTVGFEMGFVFILGLVSVVDCVWEVGLFHTAMLDSMYRCGDVGVEACGELVV